MRTIALRLATVGAQIIELVDRWLAPVFDLGLRIYVASVFFRSGLTKIADWGSTIALFENEYKVPLLSPQIAAFMGAGGELALPVLLVLGLGGRFAAAGLSVVNVIAVISYADLSDLGRQDHLLWGLLLLVTVLHGPGRLSIDHWLKKRIFSG